MTLTLCGAAVAAVFAVAAAPVHAQDWPTRPIRVITPFFVDSAADKVARVILDRVSQRLGQPMVLEAMPGDGGVVGFGTVANSYPDGYTLVASSPSMATEVVLRKGLLYDPARDFIPVVLIGTSPSVLIASAHTGFKTVADLVAAARTKPGALTFTSAGIGSSSHMAGERFRLAANINVHHFPFREGGLQEVMSGAIDFYFVPIAAAASVLDSPKLTPLAVSSRQRAPLLPKVPSIVEAGYPAAVFRFWNGLSAPAKTPRAIVDRLHDATEQVLSEPEVRQQLAKIGVDPQQMTVEQFGKFFADDLAATVELARKAQIEPID